MPTRTHWRAVPALALVAFVACASDDTKYATVEQAGRAATSDSELSANKYAAGSGSAWTPPKAGSAAADSGSGSSSPDAFCTEYGKVCGWAPEMRYASQAECVTKFNNWSTTRQACIVMHLGLAEGDDAMLKTTHCPHAAGAGPCAM
jgi:hypothetical protein